jgi:hypothetical protein
MPVRLRAAEGKGHQANCRLPARQREDRRVTPPESDGKAGRAQRGGNDQVRDPRKVDDCRCPTSRSHLSGRVANGKGGVGPIIGLAQPSATWPSAIYRPALYLRVRAPVRVTHWEWFGRQRTTRERRPQGTSGRRTAGRPYYSQFTSRSALSWNPGATGAGSDASAIHDENRSTGTANQQAGRRSALAR